MTRDPLTELRAAVDQAATAGAGLEAAVDVHLAALPAELVAKAGPLLAASRRAAAARKAAVVLARRLAPSDATRHPEG